MVVKFLSMSRYSIRSKPCDDFLDEVVTVYLGWMDIVVRGWVSGIEVTSDVDSVREGATATISVALDSKHRRLVVILGDVVVLEGDFL